MPCMDLVIFCLDRSDGSFGVIRNRRRRRWPPCVNYRTWKQKMLHFNSDLIAKTKNTILSWCVGIINPYDLLYKICFVADASFTPAIKRTSDGRLYATMNFWVSDPLYDPPSIIVWKNYEFHSNSSSAGAFVKFLWSKMRW